MPATPPRASSCPELAAPRAISSLVGRSSELETLTRALHDGQRLVSVIGPPGAGKSRLVLEAWRSLEHAAIAYCELEGVRDFRTAESEIARALAELGNDRRPAILILDNADGICDQQPAIEELLRHSGDLQLLVTARSRLNIAGEAIVEVVPLSTTADSDNALPEALALLVERTAAARPGFAPSPEELALLGRLTHLLDGLPLALESAALALRSMSAEEAIDRVNDILCPTETERQNRASVGGALLTAWESLTADERLVLRQCCVFRGQFSSNAAENVLTVSSGAMTTARSILDRLCDRSLVRRVSHPAFPGEVRFEMYASFRSLLLHWHAHQDASGTAELSSTFDRHAIFYRALWSSYSAASPELDSSVHPKMLADFPNVQLALARRSAGIEAQHEDDSINLRAIALFRRVGDRHMEAMCIGYRALVHHEHGRIREAEAGYRDAVAEFPADTPASRGARAYFQLQLGWCLVQNEAVDQADQLFGEVLSTARALPSSVLTSRALAAQAVCAALLDQVSRALNLISAARSQLRPHGSGNLEQELRLHGLHVDLARARKSRRLGHGEQADTLRSDVVGVIGRIQHQFGSNTANPNREAQLALALLLATSGRDLDLSGQNQMLTVSCDLLWVQSPRGHRVDLARRPAVRGVLEALIRAHELEPGRALSRQQIQEAGWPGELLRREVGKRRVHTTIYTLRHDLGLEELVKSRHDGYFLNPSACVVRVG